MRKHTPGPWEVRRDGWGHHSVRSEPEQRTIAKTIMPHIPDRAHAVDEANARLIAAAPEMLAAAKRILPYLTECDCVGDGMFRQLADAIAKAEGEA